MSKKLITKTSSNFLPTNDEKGTIDYTSTVPHDVYWGRPGEVNDIFVEMDIWSKAHLQKKYPTGRWDTVRDYWDDKEKQWMHQVVWVVPKVPVKVTAELLEINRFTLKWNDEPPDTHFGNFDVIEAVIGVARALGARAISYKYDGNYKRAVSDANDAINILNQVKDKPECSNSKTTNCGYMIEKYQELKCEINSIKAAEAAGAKK